MSTGDLKNNVKKLQTQIKAIKYTGRLDYDGFKDGSPKAFLPLYHYIFTSYSNKLNKDISNSNNELYGKSDLRFVEAVYKILRDMFSYKPPVTREQFFLPGFAERKVIMATEILSQVHSAYGAPSSSSTYRLASKIEKKQRSIHTKVQVCSQEEDKSKAKPRKVSCRPGADLTEAIVLPRYVSSSRSSWRGSQNSNAHGSSFSQISDTDDSPCPEATLSPRPSQASAEEADDKTLQFTEHITNALTMLNMQVGKISNALLKVETQIASKEMTTLQQMEPPKPAPTDCMQMDTLVSKVILLENRMTIMETKVEDIQNFCTILLENQNNNNNNSSNRADSSKQNAHSLPSAVVNQSETPVAVTEPRGLHPSYIQAFTSVADLGGGFKGRGQTDDNDNHGEVRVHNDDNGDDITIEDVVAKDNENPANFQSRVADMNFMKTLVGPDDSAASFTVDQENVSALMAEFQSQMEPLSSKTTKTNLPQREKRSQLIIDDSFDSNFSPIRGHKDSSLVHGGENSLSHFPCAGGDEDKGESHRLSSTPNKADLDSSTISRVHRIMDMMKETQQQFQTQKGS